MPAENCNYPGCNNPLPPYRGQGPRPKRCVDHRAKSSPEEQRERNRRFKARHAVIDGDENTPDDRARWNIEVGSKRVELVIDPTGDFRPGARFDAADILEYGNNMINGGKGMPARSCWDIGTMFIVKSRNGVSRYWVTPEHRMARVAT